MHCVKNRSHRQTMKVTIYNYLCFNRITRMNLESPFDLFLESTTDGIFRSLFEKIDYVNRLNAFETSMKRVKADTHVLLTSLMYIPYLQNMYNMTDSSYVIDEKVSLLAKLYL